MKTSLIFFVVLVASSIGLNAQSVSFQIEGSIVFADTTNITPSTPGATVLSATMDAADFNALSFTTGNAATFIAELQALETASTSDGWVEVPQAVFPVNLEMDWSLTRTGLTVDSVPVLLFTTAPLNSLTSDDYVGLVASSTLVPSGGAVNINFFGTNQWDNFKLGSTSGAFNLQPIPEPAHYAAFLGILGLAFVMWRRRR